MAYRNVKNLRAIGFGFPSQTAEINFHNKAAKNLPLN